MRLGAGRLDHLDRRGRGWRCRAWPAEVSAVRGRCAPAGRRGSTFRPGADPRRIRPAAAASARVAVAEREAHRGAAVLAHRLGRDEVHRRRAHEAGDEEVGRPVVDRLRLVELLQLALVHDRDARGERHRLDLVVGDVDRGLADPVVQLLDLGAHLDAELGVEVGQAARRRGRARGRAPAPGPWRRAGAGRRRAGRACAAAAARSAAARRRARRPRPARPSARRGSPCRR